MAKETNPIVQARHAAYRTPKSVLFDLVREATGRAGRTCEKIARGYDNEVYHVGTEGGPNVIVRIRWHGETPLAQEAWALAQARAAGAPVPDVLLLTARVLDEGNSPREIMVQRALAGRAASDLWPTWTPNERASVCGQAGAALRQIHSVRVGGFYGRHADGSWDFPTWRRLAETSLRDRTGEAGELRRAGFSSRDIASLLRIMADAPGDLAGEPPVLCHGDFVPDHWIVDDTLTLRGVIDFGEFFGGPPLADFGLLTMDHPEVNLDEVRRGYGDAPEPGDGFLDRLRRHSVGLNIGSLAHCIRSGDAPEAERLARCLHDLLTTLGKD